MKLQYLGTAAAEAIPALFCRCETCRRAREAGGKDIRGRSGLLINDTTLIDFPPDIYMTSLRFGINLLDVRDIFVTHSHFDHFDINELSMRNTNAFCHLGENDAPYVNVYGNDGVEKLVNEFRDGNLTASDFLRFTQTQYGEAYRSHSGLVFTCLPARHMPDERSSFYMIEDGGKCVLYAHDTGIFLEEVYSLVVGKRFDMVSLDCCSGFISSGYSGHMGVPENMQVVKHLHQIGCVDEKTKVILNHFSHNCGQNHAELERDAAALDFLVAYDGMIVNL